MQYKTIVLELLQQRPEMHDQLRRNRMLLPTLELYASELKTSHEAWKDTPLPGEAGQRPEPDRERGAGDGPQGTGGSFALRVSSGRQRTAFPRRSNGVHPPSHAARVKASRHQPTLFDFAALLHRCPSPPPAPPGPSSDGTLISPPGRASGNRFPLKVPPIFRLPRSLARPGWG